MAEKKSDQKLNEGQFFAIEAKGRGGLKQMVTHYKDQMWAIRPGYLPNKSKEAYFARAMVAIGNDEKLKPLLQTRTGLLTLYQQMCKAVTLGLNLGGIRPHAYIVAYGNSATLIPTADGYKFAVCAGDHAIFKDVLFGTVCENDKGFKVDEAMGVVEAPFDPTQKRGALRGIWVKMIPRSDKDRPVVKFCSLEKIHGIRDAHSASWNGKNRAASPWSTDPEEQAIKTAIKSALKPYIGQCEGLASLIEQEAAEYAEYNDQGVSDRMNQRLDGTNTPAPESVVSEQTGRASEPIEEPPPEKETSEEAPPEPAKKKKESDLF